MLLCREQIDLVTCAAEESTRYALRGIHVEAKNACTSKVTATDGRRLAQVTCRNGGIPSYRSKESVCERFANPDSNGSFTACTVDAGTVKGMRKSWPKAKRDQDDSFVAIASDGLRVGMMQCRGGMIDDDGGQLAIRPLEGDFPDYQAVIPANVHRHIIVKAQDLIELLDMADGVTNDGNGCSSVHCEIGDDDMMVISGKHFQSRHSDETFDAEVKGEIGFEQTGSGKNGKVSTYFSPYLMVDLLKVAGAINDKVRLEFGEDLDCPTAIVVKAESSLDCKTFLGLLMPISAPEDY